jgi:pimeloyl-ACP methyl ester carboxylesterase
MTNIKTIKGPNADIAYEFIEGASALPPIVFLCGFKSDMMGSKAQWLCDYCATNDRTFLRFDYFAHGQSGGDFMDFTIGHAVDDALFMLDKFIHEPSIIIGSSMGGWVGLRVLEMRIEDVFGFIGIAAAPDFTAEIKRKLSDEQKADLNRKGYFEEESGYEEPYIFTQALLDNGDVHCMLNRVIKTERPVHLIQGKLDTSVPWEKANGIQAMVGGLADVTFIDDGDHSLSRPQDLDVLKLAIEKMAS